MLSGHLTGVLNAVNQSRCDPLTERIMILKCGGENDHLTLDKYRIITKLKKSKVIELGPCNTIM